MNTVSHRSQSLSSPIILDGIARTGKFFLGKVFCGFEGVEYFQYVSMIEQVPYLHKLGFIDESAAISLLQVNIDEHCYNMQIGRNINLRLDDGSSVPNSLESEVYKNRSISNINKELIVKQCADRFSPFITHETFPQIQLFFKAFKEIKVISLKRHPIDVVHSWLIRGWGNRFENSDIFAFVPLIENNNLIFPWYVNGWEKEYHNISEAEKIIKCISVLMDHEKQAYKNLSLNNRKKVFFVRYEDLVERPENELHKIGKFVGKKTSNRMHKILKNEKCPNNISLKIRKEKMRDISNKASNKYIDLLLDISCIYESNLP
jgi:hypothetical protein